MMKEDIRDVLNNLNSNIRNTVKRITEDKSMIFPIANSLEVIYNENDEIWKIYSTRDEGDSRNLRGKIQLKDDYMYIMCPISAHVYTDFLGYHRDYGTVKSIYLNTELIEGHYNLSVVVKTGAYGTFIFE